MASVEEEARQLALKHYEIEEGVRQIIRLRQEISVEIQHAGKGADKIGLLEVNENTVPAGVMPIEFAPVPESGINYPSMIVEVTPAEFDQIRSNELRLPDGWTIAEEIPRPDGEQ